MIYLKERAFCKAYNQNKRLIRDHDEKYTHYIINDELTKKLISQYGLDKYLKGKHYPNYEDIENAVNHIFAKKNFSKEIGLSIKNIMPLLILIFSFIFVTWIGGKLQEDSFNRNIIFETKLKRFEYAQKKVMEISFDLRDIHYRINDDLSIDKNASRYYDNIREQRRQLEVLANSLRLFPSKVRRNLNHKVLVVLKDIDSYLRGRHTNIDIQNIDSLKEEVSIALIYYLETMEE